MTHMHQVAVRRVADQIINMLTNNILEDNGTESFEGWCEARRLDYPAFGTVKGSQMYDMQYDSSYKPQLYQPGTFYTPIQVFDKVGENHLLERWIYAESSSARNNNTPEFPGYTAPVFWGK